MFSQRLDIITTWYPLFSLPIIPPHNTYYNAQRNPSFFCNRLTVRASLPVDIIIGILFVYVCSVLEQDRPVAVVPLKNKKCNIAYEMARHKWQQHTDKQADSQYKLFIPHYQPGYNVLIRCPVPLLMDPMPNFVFPGMASPLYVYS